MSWDAAFSESISELAAAPPAAQPATLTEVWNAEWKAAGLDTAFGVRRPMSDAYLDFSKAFETMTGKSPFIYARDNQIPFSQFAGTPDQATDMVARLTATLPEDQRKQLEGVADLHKRAIEKAAAIEKESADVSARTYGMTGAAVGFAAGIARQTVDPINLATMPIGGSLKGPVLGMLAREFAINAGAQVVQEPMIQTGRAELGLEAGFAQGMTNVLEAGVGGAGLAGLLRGGAAVLRRLGMDFSVSPEARDLGVPADGGGAGLAPGAPARVADQVAAEPQFTAGALRAPLGGPQRPVVQPQAPAAVARQAPAPAELAEVNQAMSRAMPEEARGIEPEDLTAAADLVERNQVFDQPTPDLPPAAHVELVDSAADALENGKPITADEKKIAELAAAHARSRTRSPQKTPMTLTQFLAANGGLVGVPDLDAIGLTRKFVPRYGSLVRKTGRTLDQARELATEAGYLRGGMGETTPADLLRALDEEARGHKIFSEKQNPEAAATTGFEARMDDDTAAYFAKVDKQAKAIVRRAQKEGLGDIDADVLDVAARSMVDGTEKNWDDALERATIQSELRRVDAGARVRDVYGEDIPPGWDEDALQRGATQGDGREAEAAGGGRAGPGSQTAALGESGDVRDLGQPGRTELTEAGEQRLIPGVAPVTVRERLEAAAGAPLKGGDAPAGGLFDAEARAQVDLLDTINESRAADITARIAENPDFKFINDAGAEVKAADMLEAIERDARAADELLKCIGGETAETAA